MMQLLSFLFASASAETAAAAPAAGMSSLPLFTKGLITTGMGLLGVFLVLLLFFITIKLMQKIK